MKKLIQKTFAMMLGAALLATPLISVQASSHSEAPLISKDRFADNTDTYAFLSTAAGREGYVTLIANYIPFQEPSGGPQFYPFDDTVLYEIKIDNTGDGEEDVTYSFEFQTTTVNGATVLGQSTLNQDAVIGSINDPDYNQFQTYRVRKTNRRTRSITIASGLKTPPSNIGSRVTPNYEQNLAQAAVYDLPNGGKVFAGQRDEGFYIDVGGVFDAINLRSIGANGGVDTTKGFNVSSIAIEVPIAELTSTRSIPASPTSNGAVIGVWATASRRSTRVINPNGTQINEGPFRQISRLGNPLVNEVVIPLNQKDAFNASSPADDAVFAPSVIDPELARLMNAVFGITVPAAPRTDLVAIFATGIAVNPITGPNYTTFLSDGLPHEYLRLNVAIPPTPDSQRSRLGLLGGDVAGFPNGRRVGDDVTDIALRAMAGGTPFTPATNISPNNTLGDGVSVNDVPFLNIFPYLGSPNAGNMPRTSNQTLQGRDGDDIAVVDIDGKLQ